MQSNVQNKKLYAPKLYSANSIIIDYNYVKCAIRLFDIDLSCKTVLSCFFIHKVEKDIIVFDCSSLTLHSLVLYIKILLKIYTNLTRMIIAVNVATSSRYPHNITCFHFSLYFIILSTLPWPWQAGRPDAGAGGAKYLRPHLLLSG